MVNSRQYACWSTFLLALGILAFANQDNVRAEEKTVGSAPVALPTPPPPAPPQVVFGGFAVQVPIGPHTPVKDLLPVTPNSAKPAKPVLVENLTQVPEVEFQASLPKEMPVVEMTRQISMTIAKINVLNNKKMDAFLEELRKARPDVDGLPFAMGDKCRIKGTRSQQFGLSVLMLRRNMQEVDGLMKKSAGLDPKDRNPAPPKDAATAELFWKNYKANFAKEDWARPEANFERQEDVIMGRIAALMQVLLPESAPMRLGLVRYLSHISHVEATRALARLAVFSVEEEVRTAAIEALKTRRERDYTEVLVQGLRYPLPSVARQASEAIVKLERNDLVAQLVSMLDEPDPRAPMVQEVDKKKVTVVREVVRLNHNKNCLMCHAPGDNNSRIVPMSAAIPVPGEPPPPDGYRNPTGPDDILVRIDVTYLRQDFSLMQAVPDANPWPSMQRFDFLVRTRQVSEKEAVAYKELLAQRKPGELSPYQRATVNALSKLTGKDTEPTARAWKQVLGMATP